MTDRMTERDEITLHILAILKDTTRAEQRRRALAAYAEQARKGNPKLAEAVEAALRSREARRRPPDTGNVVTLRLARDA